LARYEVANNIEEASMPQFVTENDYTNRKVKYQTVASGFVTFLTTAAPLIAIINPDLASQLGASEETLKILALAIAAGLAAVVSVASWVAGYFTAPGQGDGTKEVKK